MKKHFFLFLLLLTTGARGVAQTDMQVTLGYPQEGDVLYPRASMPISVIIENLGSVTLPNDSMRLSFSMNSSGIAFRLPGGGTQSAFTVEPGGLAPGDTFYFSFLNGGLANIQPVQYNVNFCVDMFPRGFTDPVSANNRHCVTVSRVDTGMPPKPPRLLHHVFPGTGGNAGITTVTLYGAGFQLMQQLKLMKSGSPDLLVPDSMIDVKPSGETLTARLDLLNQDTGLWNVVVTLPDTVMTLPGAFRVSTLQLNGGPPLEGGNTGFVTVRIPGKNIPENVRVKLTRSGYGDIDAPESSISVMGPNKIIQATFDLRGQDTGYRDVVAYTPGGPSATWSDGFHIVPGIDSCPVISVVGPATARANTVVSYTIRIDNVSNVDQRNVVLAYATSHDTVWIQGLRRTNGLEHEVSTDTFNRKLMFNLRGGVLVIDQILAGSSVTYLANAKTIPTQAVGWPSFTAGVSCALDFDLPATDECLRELVSGLPGATAPPNPGCLSSQLAQIVTDSVWGFGDFGTAILQAIEQCTGLPPSSSGYDYVVGRLLKQKHNDSASACFGNLGPYLQKTVRTEVIGSYDPNDKSGPAGSGEQGYLSADERTFTYLINFENLATASAAAQIVRVIDTLDTQVFDVETFELGSVKVADSLIPIPPGLQEYTGYVDYRDLGGDYILQIDAGIDKATGIATWEFTTLDSSMKPTTDPLAGFLPPNQQSPEGQGGVFFTIKTKEKLPDNTAIENRACIYFDQNAPILTNTWSNRTDTVRPGSQVASLPVYSKDTLIQLHWNGTDNGSGIQHYSIYISRNGRPYELWISETTETEGWFTGKYDSSYAFYSVAVDSVGNREIAPLTPDAFTTMVNCLDKLQPRLDTTGATTICEGDTVILRISGGNSYTWNDGDNAGTRYITQAGLYTAEVSDTFGCSRQTDTTEITVLPAPPAPVISVSGDTLQSSYADGHQWYRNDTLIQGATDPIYVTTTAGRYTVSYTDTNGCTSFSAATDYAPEKEPKTVHLIGRGKPGVQVYPNPAEDFFTVTGDNIPEKEVVISLFNLQGQLLLQASVPCAGNRFLYRLDLSDNPAGSYMLRVQAGSWQAAQKIRKL
jgi:hypothetical protein